MEKGVKKTVSFLGKDIDIVFPSQETINTMRGRHHDRVDLGDGLILVIEVFGTCDSRHRKFFRVKTDVFLNGHCTVVEHTTVPVVPDKVLETLDEEVDLTLESVEANIKARHKGMMRDAEKLGELAAKFDSSKGKAR